MKTPSSYISPVLCPQERKIIVERLLEALKPLDFDFVACRGVSGLSVCPIIAYLLDKPYMVIRKPEEHSHSGALVEFHDQNAKFEKYIIIDDLISTGNTIMKIHNKIKERFSAQCVAILTFEQMFMSKKRLQSVLLGTIGIDISVIPTHPGDIKEWEEAEEFEKQSREKLVEEKEKYISPFVLSNLLTQYVK